MPGQREMLSQSNILIVEDEAVRAKEIARTVEDLGYHSIGPVRDMKDALRMVEESVPDLILMDIDSGGEKDGLKAVQEIRSRFDIPVVYLTDYSDQDALEKAGRTEPYGYVAKPVRTLELRSAIETALQRHEAEKRIRVREAMIVKGEEMGKVGSWDWNVVSGEIACSDQLYRNFGYAPHEVNFTYDLFMDAVHPDDREKIDLALKKSLSTDEPYDQVFRVIRADGAIGVLHTRGEVVSYDVDRPTRMAGWAQDITHSTEAREKIRASERRYRLLLEHLQAGVVVHAPDTSILFCNEMALRWFDITDDKIVGKTAAEPIWNFVREDGSPMPVGEYPVNTVLSTREPFTDLVVGVKRPRTEEIVWGLASAHPVFDEKGELEQVVVSFMDITARKQSEEQLKASKNRLHLVADNIPGLVAYVDSELHYRYVNRRYEEWPGFARDEILGKHVKDVLGDSTFQKLRPHFDKALSGEEAAFEESLTYRGEQRWLNARYFPEIDRRGQVVGVFALITDVTERRKLQEGKNQALDLLRMGEDIGRFGCWSHDPTTGREIWSEGEYRIHGISEQIVPYMELHLQRVHPDDREQHTRLFEEHLASDRTNFSQEYRIQTHNGTIRHISATYQVQRDDEGRPFSVIGTDKDITERKRAEQALRESERRFRELVENLNDVIFSTDLDGTISYVTPSVERSLGYPPSELIGRKFQSLIHPDDIVELINTFQSVLENHLKASEYRIRTKSDDYRWVRSSSRPVFKEGKPVGINGVAVDISERKKAEESLRSRMELERAITNISARLISVDHRNLDSAVNLTLQELGMVTGVDRSYVFRYSDDAGKVANTHEWVSTGIEPQIHNLQSMDIEIELPWFYERIKLNGVFHIQSMRNLPPDAAQEQKLFQLQDIQSLVVVPIATGTELLGFLGFDSVRSEMHWTDEVVTCLKLVGNMLANAFVRKRADESIRSSEQKYRNLVETMREGVALVDENARITYANSGLSKMTGYSVEQIVGRSPEDFLDRENRQIYRKQLASRINGKKHGNYELSINAKDGRKITVVISVSEIYDRQDNFVLSMAVFTDITNLKKVEDALAAREAQFQAMFDSVVDAVIFADTQRRIVMVNPAFTNTWGYSADEAIGRTTEFLYAYREDFERLGLQKFRSDTKTKSGLFRMQYRHKDGSVFEAESVGGQVINPEGRILGYMALHRDLTERNEMEKRLIEAQRMEAVGTLAGGIAHDFNNLLQIILGNTEFLEMEHFDRDLHFPESEAIRQSAERGADLVRQILTFSRRIDGEFKRVNINDTIRNVEKLLFRALPKMIAIEMNLESTLKSVQADSSQIEQLLINLATNAKDAMPEGGKLIFETDNVELDEEFCLGLTEISPGEYVRLRVADTGSGMSEEVLGRVFEPFFTTKGHVDGTGLGLATVFGIVKMHGGHITCESEVGRGTSVCTYFPVAEAHTTQVESESDISDWEGGDETILLVDDEPMITNLATKILETAGYTVMSASSGVEALDVYRKSGSDIALIILDLIMPKMGGKECLEQLLRIDPEVKVLIASGFFVKGEHKAFLGAHAKGMVTKPFNLKELLRSVRQVLDTT